MLNRELAGIIVQETMQRLRRNINMMDMDGRIIASGDRKRLGERHEGALEVLRTGRPLIIGRDNEADWKGSQRGINVPVVFRQELVGVIGITGEPEEVAEFGEIVKMTTELLLNQMVTTSHQEWRNRAKEAVIEELLKRQPDFAKVDDRLQMLQLRLIPPFHAFRIDMETEEDKAAADRYRQLEAAITGCLGDGYALAVMENTRRAAILLYGLAETKAASVRGQLGQALRQAGLPARIGYSLPADDRAGIPAAFREAELALLFHGRDAVLAPYAGIEPQAIVYGSDPGGKQRYAHRMLSELSEPMIRTLEAFFDCGLSIQGAAQALYVHRNTLIYRLKRIKELTGCDPQVFRDAAALQIAVWIHTEPESLHK